MKATVGSLFSGIGGIDLACERAGFEVRWQVENDPACVRVLEKHWSGVKRYGDIRTVRGQSMSQMRRVEAPRGVSQATQHANGQALMVCGVLQRLGEGETPAERYTRAEAPMAIDDQIRNDRSPVRGDAYYSETCLCDMRDSTPDGLLNSHRSLSRNGEDTGPALSPLQHKTTGGGGRGVSESSIGLLEPVNLANSGQSQRSSS